MLCSCGVNNIFGTKLCKSCGSSLETKNNTSSPNQSIDYVTQASPTSAQPQNQAVAASTTKQETPVKSAGSELDFIPYTSNTQFNYFIKGEFWYFVLFEILTLLLIGIFSTTLYALASLVMIIPATSVMVRRMHDIGTSWKWLLLVFIPIVGLVVLYWLIQSSESNENAWCPAPTES